MPDDLILVVEDDPTLRIVLKRALNHLGYQCLTVGSGEEAVDSQDASLIFMDIGLPGMDGVRTTMLIRERELREGRKRIPIVALTAHWDRDKCVLAGMDDFLQKPALMADLKRVLDKFLEEKTERQ